MFHKIVVAYNESPESERALVVAIQLASSLHAELLTVTAMGDLPVYTAYAEAADPSRAQVLEQDRLKFYTKLQEKVRAQVESHGIEFRSHLVEGKQVEAIVD